MINMFRLTFLLFFCFKAVGGTADLAISLNFNEVDGVVLDRQGEFVATITNNGPDVAAENSGFQFPITLSSGIIQDNGNFTPDVQFAAAANNNNQECLFVLVIGDPPPGGSVSYGYNLSVPEIPVNETITCNGIYSTHFNSGIRDVNWRIRNNFDDDPVSTNDTQTVVFGIAPRSVPVNNIYSLLALLLFTLLIGVKANRKSKEN